MTALSADKTDIAYKAGDVLPLPVGASKTLYLGALLMLNSSGYVIPGADTASCIFAGINLSGRIDNSAGSDGDEKVEATRYGVHKMTFDNSISQSDVGSEVYLVDDQTVDLSANVSNNIFCGILAGYIDSTHGWVDIVPAIEAADVATHIADSDDAHAASAISLADSGGYTDESDVEAAIAEIYPFIPADVADPGDTGAIAVARSGACAVTTGGSGETRTLAAPDAVGRQLTITLDVDGGGDCVITAATAINVTGNNTITMADAGDNITLVGAEVGGSKVWRVVENDGPTLTTV